MESLKVDANDIHVASMDQEAPGVGSYQEGNEAMNLPDSVGSYIRYALYDFWEKSPDPQLKDYALLRGGPSIVLGLTGLYLLFVLIGPKVMKNRQAFDLKIPLRIYNFGMVILNGYLFYNIIFFMFDGITGWGCGRSIEPMPIEALPLVWLLFISRFLDFFDTIFFILRKKNSHITFLHVFHHTLVPIVYWFGVKFAFYPVACFIPSLNVVVHIIMYTYYGLSTFGPGVKRYLWWKKYLTRIQITQFIIAIVHSLQPIYLRHCTFPAFFVWGQTTSGIVFLWLFVSFYIRAYMKNTPSANQDKKQAKKIA